LHPQSRLACKAYRCRRARARSLQVPPAMRLAHALKRSCAAALTLPLPTRANVADNTPTLPARAIAGGLQFQPHYRGGGAAEAPRAETGALLGAPARGASACRLALTA
jgi:hypothetical protein